MSSRRLGAMATTALVGGLLFGPGIAAASASPPKPLGFATDRWPGRPSSERPAATPPQGADRRGVEADRRPPAPGPPGVSGADRSSIRRDLCTAMVCRAFKLSGVIRLV